jgi:hypothetical protein
LPLRSALFVLWMLVTVVPWALAVLVASPSCAARAVLDVRHAGCGWRSGARA